MPIQRGLFRKLQNSLLYLAAIFVVSVTGYLLYGWDLIDSVYMVVITMFGVGFGEVRPVDTVIGKIFTMFVIVGGTSGVVYVIGELISFFTEGEIMKALGELKKSRQVDSIGRHAIVCGYGRIGQILAQQLAEEGFPFVVVDLDESRLALAAAKGYLFVKGSAIEEETLVRAGIDRALVLTTVLPQDTLNVFITLTARNLNRNLRIIARGEHPSTEKKLKQAGADEVVLPAAIGGLRIAHSITRQATMKFVGNNLDQLNDELKRFGLEVDELRLHDESQLIGKTLESVQSLSQGHILVVALQRGDGSVLRSGYMELPLKAGDSVIVVGRTRILPEILRNEFERESLT